MQTTIYGQNTVTPSQTSNPVDKRTFGYRQTLKDGRQIWASNKTYKREVNARQYASKQKQHKRLHYEVRQSTVTGEWFTICYISFN